MAFKKLEKKGPPPAIRIDEEHPTVEGFLMGVRFTPRKKSTIFEIRTEDGETVNVWGQMDINRNLLDEAQKQLDFKLRHCLVRLTYEGEQEIEGYDLPVRVVGVEVDVDKKFKDNRREYSLDKNKKFSKPAGK